MIELNLGPFAPTPQASVTSTTVGWDQFDERWFMDNLGGAGSGPVVVTPQTIFYCDVVLAAVRFLADAFAVCPPQVFRKTPGDGREPQPFHRVQRTLRDPNAWQTGFDWRHLSMVHLTTYGNAYDRIYDNGVTKPELWPLDPWRVRVVDQMPDGRLLYTFRPKNGREETLTQDQILHFRSLSTDGYSGLETWTLIRNAVAVALAVQRHELVFMKKGTRVAGVLVPDGPPAEGQAGAVKASWDQAYGGPDQTGSVAVLPYGFKFQPLGTDNQKAQVIELGNAQVEGVLRSLGVPGVVVGYQGDKASTYASADAFFEKGGIKHCILPRVVAFEQREEKELLSETEADHFIKHNMDVLTRASTKDTFDILVKARGGPVLSLNEARKILDLNPKSEPEADEVLKPGNMDVEGQEPDPAPAAPGRALPPRKPKPAPADEEDQAHQRERQYRLDAAARVVRRELTALKDRAALAGRDPAAFKAWVGTYYGRHAGHVAEAMHIEEAAAVSYSEAQRDALLEGGFAAARDWEDEAVSRLAALAQEHWRSDADSVDAGLGS